MADDAMTREAWLTLIGLGEAGDAGLTPEQATALKGAEVVMGPARHVSLITGGDAEVRTWPVPFAEGVPELLSLRGRTTVVLASGDPFWFGLGSVLSTRLEAHEWRCLPSPSVFSLAASKLGWALEHTKCVGLHAAPFERLVRHLAPGVRILATLRDGAALGPLAMWLAKQGFGATEMTVLEALGGPRERQRTARAYELNFPDVVHPVCVALSVAGSERGLAKASGLPDATFVHDGQLTKRPVRALTLSSLAPRARERLWDIGSGSGSISVEWLLAHGSTHAVAIEHRADRAKTIVVNAQHLGVEDRLQVVIGRAPDALLQLPPPSAIFIGGGLSHDMLDWLAGGHLKGVRLVANAVTLESEAVLSEWHGRFGGELLRIELAAAGDLGSLRGWRSSYPVVQWCVELP